ETRLGSVEYLGPFRWGITLGSICRVFLALLILWSLRAVPAAAQSQSFPHGTVSAIGENPWIQPGHGFTVGLHFLLENDWHTYWVNPGDSGEPARVAWELPSGVTAAPMQWPAPDRLGSSSVVDYGYKGEVTLLVPMHAAAEVPSEGQLTLRAK